MTTATQKKRRNKPDVQVKLFAATVKNVVPEGETHAQTAEMSEPEKQMLCMIVKESEPLPYPLKPLKMAYGADEEVYDIPDEDKANVFPELWPFKPCPALDDERFDIHEQKCFVFRDAQITRYKGRNLIVSPFYQRSGGMAVDFMPPECATGGSQTCAQAIKA